VLCFKLIIIPPVLCRDVGVSFGVGHVAVESPSSGPENRTTRSELGHQQPKAP
jgi:hypothetical protein